MNDLTREEREILEAFEAGKLRPTPRAEEIIARHQAYARAALKKDARTQEVTTTAENQTRRTGPR